jgi:gamma-glutamyl phosphate reductase
LDPNYSFHFARQNTQYFQQRQWLRHHFSKTGAPAADRSIEYLDCSISIKVLTGFDEAIEHINRCGFDHTDAIVTGDATDAGL